VESNGPEEDSDRSKWTRLDEQENRTITEQGALRHTIPSTIIPAISLSRIVEENVTTHGARRAQPGSKHRHASSVSSTIRSGESFWIIALDAISNLSLSSQSASISEIPASRKYREARGQGSSSAKDGAVPSLHMVSIIHAWRVLLPPDLNSRYVKRMQIVGRRR
jgi:hypothetical protein